MTISTPVSRRRFAVRALRASWLWLLVMLSGIAAAAVPKGEKADPDRRTATKRFDIPAGDAFSALKRFSAQSGEQLIYKAESLDGVKTAAVRGTYTPLEALVRMLSLTTLSVTQDATTGTLAIRHAPNGRAPAHDESDLTSAAKKKSPQP